MTSQNIVNNRLSERSNPHQGSIADIAGLHIGHFTSSQRLTGCSVVLAPKGAVGAVDVRGAAPGTRETDLLDPANLVDKVHAVLLSGGSAFGLDAASGVMRWLDERNMGFQTDHGCVPIVPAAVLFDLAVVREGDSPKVRPDAAAGYAACEDALYQKPLSASQMRSMIHPLSGNVGAGAGAVVGKLFGLHRAMKGGVGHALVKVGPWQVAAMVACNAVGDVIDPATGNVLAGARTSDGTRLLNTQQALLAGQKAVSPLAGTNTTIGVVATNASLNKAQAKRLAMSAHDGFARSIRPAHTLLDGDTLFAMATCAEEGPPDMLLLTVMAAQATAQATVNAILFANGVHTLKGYLPSAMELNP